MIGYVLTLFERIGGAAVMIDPRNSSQLLDEGKNRKGGEPVQPEEIRAVFIETPDVLRHYRVDQLIRFAEYFPEKEEAWALRDGEVAKWGLRPMHAVEVEQIESGEWVIVSVEGRTEPEEVKAIPYYGDMRLEKSFASERIAIERLVEIVQNPPDDIEEAQLEDIRDGGVLLMRILSYLAPLLRGIFMFVSGPEKGGKSFAMQMVFYLVRWVLLKEDSNSRVVFIAVGERAGELGEFQRLAADHPQIEFFGTSMDDEPLSKWVKMAYAGQERGKRHLELGRNLYLFLDSLSRLGEAMSMSAPKDEAHVTGGHALSAMTKPRQWLGLAGVYSLHPACPWALVLVTGLWETLAKLHEALTGQLGGTSDADWVFTVKAMGHPKLWLANERTSTRKLSWAKLTKLERWFIRELRRRVVEQGSKNVGRGRERFNNDGAKDWLVRLFKDRTPQEVMVHWDQERRWKALERKYQMNETQLTVAVKNLGLDVPEMERLVAAELDKQSLIHTYNAGGREDILRFLAAEVGPEVLLRRKKLMDEFRLNPDQVKLVVDQLGLAYDEVGKLLEAGLKPQDLERLADGRERVRAFLVGEIDLAELLASVSDVAADVLRMLLEEGFELPVILAAAGSVAAEDLPAHLRQKKAAEELKVDERTIRVALVGLGLTADELGQLLGKNLEPVEIVQLASLGVDAATFRGFLAGTDGRAELRAPLVEFTAGSTNQAYTKASPRRKKTYADGFCDPLRQAGISAGLVTELVAEGYDVVAIQQAAKSGAWAGDIREHLAPPLE